VYLLLLTERPVIATVNCAYPNHTLQLLCESTPLKNGALIFARLFFARLFLEKSKAKQFLKLKK